MSTTSRYRRYHESILPKKKRRIKVWGVDEDTGKFIRCWNCGFIVNTERDLGDPENSGIVLQDVVIPDLPPPHMEGVDDTQYTQMTLDTLDQIGTMVDPNVKAYYTPRASISIRGCSLCGCTNL